MFNPKKYPRKDIGLKNQKPFWLTEYSDSYSKNTSAPSRSKNQRQTDSYETRAQAKRHSYEFSQST